MLSQPSWLTPLSLLCLSHREDAFQGGERAVLLTLTLHVPGISHSFQELCQ